MCMCELGASQRQDRPQTLHGFLWLLSFASFTSFVPVGCCSRDTQEVPAPLPFCLKPRHPHPRQALQSHSLPGPKLGWPCPESWSSSEALSAVLGFYTWRYVPVVLGDSRSGHRPVRGMQKSRAVCFRTRLGVWLGHCSVAVGSSEVERSEEGRSFHLCPWEALPETLPASWVLQWVAVCPEARSLSGEGAARMWR